jgi:nucleoside-diphosphate-sugar epimerase
LEAPVSVVAGQIFNFSDDSRNTNLQIAKAFAKAAGYTGNSHSTVTTKIFAGEVLVNENGGFPHSQKTVIVDSRKSTRLLGWTPDHLGLLDEADLYFQTWKNLNKVNLNICFYVTKIVLFYANLLRFQ